MSRPVAFQFRDPFRNLEKCGSPLLPRYGTHLRWSPLRVLVFIAVTWILPGGTDVTSELLFIKYR